MKQFFRYVIKLISPYKWNAGLNILFNILTSIFGVVSIAMIIPFLNVLFDKSQKVVDPVHFVFSMKGVENYFKFTLSHLIESQGKASALFAVCILVITMMFFKTLTWYLANYFLTPLRNGVVRDMRNQIYSKILGLPLGYFTETRKGDVLSRMTGDVQEIEWSIMSSLEMMFREPIMIIISLVGLLWISPQLTLFVFILLPVAGTIIGLIGKNLRKTSMKGQIKMGEVMSTIEETLSGLRVIKAFNAEKRAYATFYRQNNEYTRIANRIMRKRFLASPVSEFLGVGTLVIVLWYGGNMALAGNKSISSEALIGFVAIFSQIINPAKNFTQAFYNIQKGRASLDRVNAILDADERIVEKPDAIEVKKFGKEIEFRNASFAYENEKVLKNINLKIEKGKSIALVGQSGSGKSTLVDLIPRFYDIQEGDILLDGTSIKDLKLTDLRGLMGNVNQEAILFNDSFYNNIAFGVENTTPEAVEAAAKVANAHEFIIATENGYETNIGDRGGKLSGGQRQRISIARAVLKNPPILILDEATSALDTESEHLVQEALFNLMKNRTSIVIAHRLSTIKNADEICVLYEGEIVERGKHEELLALNGHYKKLYDLQIF
ncbi:MAG: ABC transporter ATP-binding protein [Bacteroidota bacterium]|nr:ABC transporter ATP-binding protein [Bacteroidota bacterium]